MSLALSHPERRARRAEIATDIEGGMGLIDAATKYKVSVAWAKVACHEFGVILPSYTKVSVVKVVAELIDQWPNPDLTEIGLICSLSRQRVYQILQQCLRYGIVKEEHDEYPSRDQEVGGVGR